MKYSIKVLERTVGAVTRIYFWKEAVLKHRHGSCADGHILCHLAALESSSDEYHERDDVPLLTCRLAV